MTLTDLSLPVRWSTTVPGVAMFSDLWFRGDSLYSVDGGYYNQMRLRRFDASNGQLIASVKHSRNVRDLLLTDGKLYVLCDRGIDIYDNSSFELLARWNRHRLPVYANHLFRLGEYLGMVNVDRLTAFNPNTDKRRHWKFDDTIRAASNGQSAIVATVGGEISYLADADSKLVPIGKVPFVDHVAVDQQGFIVFASSLRRARVTTPAKSWVETPLADVAMHRFSFDGKKVGESALGAAFWLNYSWYCPTLRLSYMLEVKAFPKLRFALRILDTYSERWRGTIDVPAEFFPCDVDTTGSKVAFLLHRDDGKQIIVADLAELQQAT
jgi:hypothetical protein